MDPIIIYVHYNGEITNSHEGIQYQGEHAKRKIIRLKHRIQKLSKLNKQICRALELGHHLHVMTITYRHPHIILYSVAKFILVLIISDDDVNLMFDVHIANISYCVLGSSQDPPLTADLVAHLVEVPLLEMMEINYGG